MHSHPPDARAPPATSLSSQCCRPPTPTPALSPPWSSHLLQMARPPHSGLCLTAFFIGKIWGENCVGLIRGPAGPGLAACCLPKSPARWLAGQNSFPSLSVATTLPQGMSVQPLPDVLPSHAPTLGLCQLRGCGNGAGPSVGSSSAPWPAPSSEPVPFAHWGPHGACGLGWRPVFWAWT